MNFSQALELIKRGKNLQRAGWNGRGLFVYLTHFPDHEPCLTMRTADGRSQPGWLASQADMLADDWREVPLGA